MEAPLVGLLDVIASLWRPPVLATSLDELRKQAQAVWATVPTATQPLVIIDSHGVDAAQGCGVGEEFLSEALKSVSRGGGLELYLLAANPQVVGSLSPDLGALLSRAKAPRTDSASAASAGPLEWSPAVIVDDDAQGVVALLSAAYSAKLDRDMIMPDQHIAIVAARLRKVAMRYHADSFIDVLGEIPYLIENNSELLAVLGFPAILSSSYLTDKLAAVCATKLDSVSCSSTWTGLPAAMIQAILAQASVRGANEARAVVEAAIRWAVAQPVPTRSVVRQDSAQSAAPPLPKDTAARFAERPTKSNRKAGVASDTKATPVASSMAKDAFKRRFSDRESMLDDDTIGSSAALASTPSSRVLLVGSDLWASLERHGDSARARLVLEAMGIWWKLPILSLDTSVLVKLTRTDLLTRREAAALLSYSQLSSSVKATVGKVVGFRTAHRDPGPPLIADSQGAQIMGAPGALFGPRLLPGGAIATPVLGMGYSLGVKHRFERETWPENLASLNTSMATTSKLGFTPGDRWTPASAAATTVTTGTAAAASAVGPRNPLAGIPDVVGAEPLSLTLTGDHSHSPTYVTHVLLTAETFETRESLLSKSSALDNRALAPMLQDLELEIHPPQLTWFSERFDSHYDAVQWIDRLVARCSSKRLVFGLTSGGGGVQAVLLASDFGPASRVSEQAQQALKLVADQGTRSKNRQDLVNWLSGASGLSLSGKGLSVSPPARPAAPREEPSTPRSDAGSHVSDGSRGSRGRRGGRGRVDSGRGGSTRVDSGRGGSTRVDSGRGGSTRVDSGRGGSTRVDSGRGGSTRRGRGRGVGEDGTSPGTAREGTRPAPRALATKSVKLSTRVPASSSKLVALGDPEFLERSRRATLPTAAVPDLPVSIKLDKVTPPAPPGFSTEIFSPPAGLGISPTVVFHAGQHVGLFSVIVGKVDSMPDAKVKANFHNLAKAVCEFVGTNCGPATLRCIEIFASMKSNMVHGHHALVVDKPLSSDALVGDASGWKLGYELFSHYSGSTAESFVPPDALSAARAAGPRLVGLSQTAAAAKSMVTVVWAWRPASEAGLVEE
jgi:hypothetical protein